MKDFKDDSVAMAITHYIEFQIRKHGNYGPHDNVVDAVNAMTNYEVLELIANYLQEQRTSGQF